MWDPSSSLGSACGVVEEPQESSPDCVDHVESPATVKTKLLEARLLSGLVVLKAKMKKRGRLSSKGYQAPGSAYGDVNKPRVGSPTAVKPELWESQLLSGLAIMEERLGK